MLGKRVDLLRELVKTSDQVLEGVPGEACSTVSMSLVSTQRICSAICLCVSLAGVGTPELGIAQ